MLLGTILKVIHFFHVFFSNILKTISGQVTNYKNKRKS